MNEDIKTLSNGVELATYAKTIILNEKNEILILTISKYEARPERSYQPDLPGGHIKVGIGEAEKDGALRETKEETGIDLKSENTYLAYTNTTFHEDQNRSVIGLLYIAHLDYTPEVTVSWEHASYEWLPMEELMVKEKFRSFHEVAIQYCIDNRLV